MGGLLTKRVCVISDPFLLQYREAKLQDIEESYEILRDLFGYQNSLSLEQFDQVFGLWLGDSEPHFNFWSNHRPRVDCYQVFAGSIVYARGGHLGAKIEFIFKLFDFNKDKTVSFDELTILVLSCFRGMNRLAGSTEATDRRYTRQITSIVDKIFVAMDVDKNERITCDEFRQYVLNTPEVMSYLELYTDSTDIFGALATHKQKLQRILNDFESIADENQMTDTTQALGILNPPILGSALNNRDFKAAFDYIDHKGRTHLEEFRDLAQVILSFDIVDKNHDGELNIAEMRSLLWLENGKEPSNSRLSYELSQYGGANRTSITLKDWMRHLATVAISAKSDKAASRFQLGLHELFLQADASDDGKLSKSELATLINSRLQEDFGIHTLTKAGRDLLESVASGLTSEIYERVDVDENKNVSWDEFKNHIDFLWEREREIILWFYDFQSNPFARAFEFDADASARIDKNELVSLLMSTLRHPISYRLISHNDAHQLATKTAQKMLDIVAVGDAGSISAQDVHRQAQSFLAIEKSMLEQVDLNKNEQKKILRSHVVESHRARQQKLNEGKSI